MLKLITTLCLFMAMMLGACSAPQTSDKDSLYVSILPLRELIHEIVGDDFEVKVLVPPGANPETFELSARQLADLHRSRLVFGVGLIPFEESLLAQLKETTINLSHGIPLLEGACGHVHNGVHGTDPHLWTSPKALKMMAKNAFDAIKKNYPDSVKYAQNYARLNQKLEELDHYAAEQIKASKIRYFIIYHPALTYYAEDYGIEQRSIEFEGKEPSARHIAKIIRQAREDRVDRIFCQMQFPKTAVEIIASDIGARIVMIDPLEEDILSNIRRITDLITEQ